MAAAGMEDQVAAMSLDHACAARMKALRPDWRVGLLAATAMGDLARRDADCLAVGARLATPDLLRRARAGGDATRGCKGAAGVAVRPMGAGRGKARRRGHGI